MTAEEHFDKRQQEITWQIPIVNTDGDYLASKNDIIKFAESYHKAKVESIDNKNIVNASLEISKQFTSENELKQKKGYTLGIIDGARWLKSELLK